MKIPKHIQQLIDTTVNAAIRGTPEYKGKLWPESKREVLEDRLRQTWLKILERQPPKAKKVRRTLTLAERQSAARGQKRILLHPPSNLAAGLREKIANQLISESFTRAERSDYLHELVVGNPESTPATLFEMAEKTIIGNMARGTFENRVSAIRKKG